MSKDNPIDHSRRAIISTAVLAAASAGVALPLAVAGKANAEEVKPMLMFVQLSEGLKVDEAAKTIRLVTISPHTLYFRRPAGADCRPYQDGGLS
jgi:hypothetical protein